MEGVNTQNDFRRWRRGPSLFFPALLITVGVIWMLVNYGQVPVENVIRLLAYWPVLLIAAGLSIILRQVSWVLNGLLWLAVGGVAVWMVLYPPANLPGYTTPEFSHKELKEPVGDAESASVKLNLSLYPANVSAVEQGNDLFVASVDYAGGLNFQANGSGKQKSIAFGESVTGTALSLPLMAYESQDQKWNIWLTPRIPMDLNINGGFGSANMDLSRLQLTALKIDAGLGSMDINLPEDSGKYKFNLNGSTSSIEVRVPSGATFDMEVNGGTGSLDITLPKDSGVQVTVLDDGIGGLELPSNFKQIVQGEDDGEGVWENDSFDRDETPIRIQIKVGVGGISIE